MSQPELTPEVRLQALEEILRKMYDQGYVSLDGDSPDYPDGAFLVLDGSFDLGSTQARTLAPLLQPPPLPPAPILPPEEN